MRGTALCSDIEQVRLSGTNDACLSGFSKAWILPVGVIVVSGNVYTFSVALTAPVTTGTYTAGFQMTNMGTPFGPVFKMTVTVAN